MKVQLNSNSLPSSKFLLLCLLFLIKIVITEERPANSVYLKSLNCSDESDSASSNPLSREELLHGEWEAVDSEKMMQIKEESVKCSLATRELGFASLKLNQSKHFTSWLNYSTNSDSDNQTLLFDVCSVFGLRAHKRVRISSLNHSQLTTTVLLTSNQQNFFLLKQFKNKLDFCFDSEFFWEAWIVFSYKTIPTNYPVTIKIEGLSNNSLSRLHMILLYVSGGVIVLGIMFFVCCCIFRKKTKSQSQINSHQNFDPKYNYRHNQGLEDSTKNDRGLTINAYVGSSEKFLVDKK